MPFYKIHGMHGTPIHLVWKNMKQRCNNPNNRGYKNYGGRGITVCERWNSFANFFSDMGDRPEGMTIERIDNDKGYSPENCRWATWLEQAQNTRNALHLQQGNTVLSLSAWARKLGLKEHSLHHRINKYGWPLEQALTTKRLTPGGCHGNNIMITINDETLCLKEWTVRYDISYDTVRARIKVLKWEPLQALTTPVQAYSK